MVRANFQVWNTAGEFCPEGTIPIRRTREDEILRASSVKHFGKKKIKKPIVRDSSSNGHEVVYYSTVRI